MLIRIILVKQLFDNESNSHVIILHFNCAYVFNSNLSKIINILNIFPNWTVVTSLFCDFTLWHTHRQHNFEIATLITLHLRNLITITCSTRSFNANIVLFLYLSSNRIIAIHRALDKEKSKANICCVRSDTKWTLNQLTKIVLSKSDLRV